MGRSNKEQLEFRGYIEDYQLQFYKNFSKEELVNLLNSQVATDRTIAAKLLKEFNDEDILKELILRLVVEKRLYTKIALSESIGSYGENACAELINHLGKVGKNQHRQLPDKPFRKNNYPLPRDIMARTICKIGSPALKHLKECLFTGEYKQILEAIDAIGFISYYENDNYCLDEIIILLDKYKDDDLMTWKLLRALQAFPDERALDGLRLYINSDIKQHKWEAIRSIKQIQRRREDSIAPTWKTYRM